MSFVIRGEVEGLPRFYRVIGGCFQGWGELPEAKRYFSPKDARRIVRGLQSTKSASKLKVLEVK